jgi:hypothetical protein
MTIATIRKPQAKFSSQFEVILESGSTSLSVSGSPSGTNVRGEIDVPSTGMGMTETPGSRAEIVITAAEFEEWAARVLKAIKENK